MKAKGVDWSTLLESENLNSCRITYRKDQLVDDPIYHKHFRKIGLESKLCDSVKHEALAYSLVKKGNRVLNEKTNLKMNHAVEDFIDDMLIQFCNSLSEMEDKCIEKTLQEEFI